MVINDGLPNFSLYWAGWKTTLFDLSRAGWTINIDHNYHDRTYSLAINNPLLKVVGLCNRITDNFLVQFGYYPDRCRGLRFEGTDTFPTLQMQYLSFKIAINIVSDQVVGMRFNQVEHIYANPFKDAEIDLSTLLGGGYVEAPESEVIVPDYTIPELMKIIKEKQAPRQKEIRDRLKKETNPKIKQEARIISLDTSIGEYRVASR